MKPDLAVIEQEFPKRVPVFPLANTVLFPGAILPLHIFEERYRAMVADALASDRLVAMALLQQCDRTEYEERPPFHETVCVGHLLHHEPLEDGRSNILLLGVSAGLASAPGDDRPYRTADVELLPDALDAASGFEDRLFRAFGRNAPGATEIATLREQLGELVAAERLPAALVGACAAAAPILPRHKLELLEERSLARRIERLIEFLERPWQWN